MFCICFCLCIDVSMYLSEIYAATSRLLADAHVNMHKKLVDWIRMKEEYLNAREEITSVAEAKKNLRLLEQYNKVRM